ncbi:MAG TPA: argininosuccinate lyase [Candidatus Methylomirabilis sp.]|nr:argininosuccinate lyase [Candidatus Methylomirabilis sp.]
MKRKKAWGGRFSTDTNKQVEGFTASIRFDQRLAPHDIRGSVAHARMLGTCGILSKDEVEAIVTGLGEIGEEIARGDFRIDPALEDIHMHIERRLIEKIGEVGGKLHTARSRNDQVALDLRLYLREAIGGIGGQLRTLQEVLVAKAEVHLDTILPGYTHLQRAQPILLAHHLLAYFEMFQRDRERLADCLVRVDVLPLGAAALAGTTLPIDRDYAAKLLGFPRIAANSVDAVSDRDFAVEFLACAAILAMHISRLAEEITLWASAEFGFLELPDAFATGSSIMPQKKNPDVAELARGKAGRVYGALLSLLTLLKGLPLSYNRDLQEDKEPVFDAVDTIQQTLAVLPPMLKAITYHPERMRAAAADGFLNATDLADYLVTKGVPFRQAHATVGLIVRECLETRQRLEDLPLERLRGFSRAFGADVYKYISLEACVGRRRSAGGTSSRLVGEAISLAKRRLRHP